MINKKWSEVPILSNSTDSTYLCVIDGYGVKSRNNLVKPENIGLLGKVNPKISGYLEIEADEPSLFLDSMSGGSIVSSINGETILVIQTNEVYKDSAIISKNKLILESPVVRISSQLRIDGKIMDNYGSLGSPNNVLSLNSSGAVVWREFTGGTTGGTISGDYLPISGGTISGGLNTTDTLIVTGNTILGLKKVPVTGTITVNSSLFEVYGIGTNFLESLSPNDWIIVYGDGPEMNLLVDSISSNELLYLRSYPYESRTNVGYNVTNMEIAPILYISGHTKKSFSNLIEYNANIIPSFDSTYNIGSESKKIKGVYVNDTVRIGFLPTTPTITAKLHVNNTGSGNSFLVEDSGNPDYSPFIIDNNGNTSIGVTGTTLAKLQINNTSNLYSFLVEDNTTPDATSFVIDSIGNVIIGNTNIVAENSFKVAISGTTSITGNTFIRGGSLFLFGNETVNGTLTVTGNTSLSSLETNNISSKSYRLSTYTNSEIFDIINSDSTNWIQINKDAGFSGVEFGDIISGNFSPVKINGLLHINNVTANPSLLIEDSTNPDYSPFIIDSDGNVSIGLSGTTLSKFRINNQTAMYSFLVEDSMSPDATSFVIDANGNVVIGNQNIVSTNINKLAISGTTSITGNTFIRGGSLFLFGNETVNGTLTVTGNTSLSSLETNNISSKSYRLSTYTNSEIFDIINSDSTNWIQINKDAGFSGVEFGDIISGNFSPVKINGLLHINNVTANPSLLIEDSTNPDYSPFIIDSDGNVSIGLSGTTLSKFRINNQTAMYSFLVEDSMSPDATSFVIDANGNVVIGNQNIVSTNINKLAISGTTSITGNTNITGNLIVNGVNGQIETSALKIKNGVNIVTLSVDSNGRLYVDNDLYSSGEISAYGTSETDTINFKNISVSGITTSVGTWSGPITGESMDMAVILLNEQTVILPDPRDCKGKRITFKNTTDDMLSYIKTSFGYLDGYPYTTTGYELTVLSSKTVISDGYQWWFI